MQWMLWQWHSKSDVVCGERDRRTLCNLFDHHFAQTTDSFQFYAMLPILYASLAPIDMYVCTMKVACYDLFSFGEWSYASMHSVIGDAPFKAFKED